MRKIHELLLSVIFVVVFDAGASAASQRVNTFYVPAYSSIFHSDLKWNFNLSITLSIHNIDLKNKIRIISIDYYDKKGKLIHRYLDKAGMTLLPLETHNIGIKETDNRGGIGGNFIVRWNSDKNVNTPVIESIMIGTRGSQGISFVSRGVAVN